MLFYLSPPRYFPATLMAKDGKIIKTVANKSRIKIWLSSESGESGPDPVMTTKIPSMPNNIEE